jgi:predicted peptidase
LHLNGGYSLKLSLTSGLALALALSICGGAVAQAPDAQTPESFKGKITKSVELNYLLYLPKDYAKSKRERFPLLLFLHGSGERGSDLNKVKVHGPPKLIAHGQDFPFIIVSPQCPDRGWWDADTLLALLDSIEKKYRVDKDREYSTGLSMGGFGTWALAAAAPDRFAAIVPISGAGDPADASKLKNVPIWAFHGAKDPTVPIQGDQEMVDAVKAAGGNIQFTIYPDGEHDVWTRTYENPEVFTWLLSHQLHKSGGY